MRRTLSFLLAAAMAAALLVCPAAAASSPWARIDGAGSSTQTVSLQGLSGQHTAVQITLNLDHAPGGLHFQSAFSDSRSYAAARLEGDSLTVYVTSQSPLNQGGSLTLGTLKADESFTVTSASGLKLLNVGPDDTQSLTYDKVSLSSGSGSGSGSSSSRYPISVQPDITGGSIQISDTRARRGDTVTITAVPESGYALSVLDVTDSLGRRMRLTDLGGGVRSFVMPAYAVTVSARFEPEQPSPLPFTDVGENDWFRMAVDYVYRNGLMSGTDLSTFSPNTPTTRGMVVAILYRYEGSPAAEPSGFQDVSPEQYYAAAVSWASACGVVSGYDDGLFWPDRTITREQMAAILFRYARYKGLDVGGRADLSAYADAQAVSAYAVDAMAWASHAGLISGMEDHTLQPAGSATRAQVASILMRLCKSMEGQL